MAGLIYMEVDEVREVDGVLVKCVKDKNPDMFYCGFCALNPRYSCLKMCCSPSDREDSNHVHFRRVES